MPNYCQNICALQCYVKSLMTKRWLLRPIFKQTNLSKICGEVKLLLQKQTLTTLMHSERNAGPVFTTSSPYLETFYARLGCLLLPDCIMCRSGKLAFQLKPLSLGMFFFVARKAIPVMTVQIQSSSVFFSSSVSVMKLYWADFCVLWNWAKRLMKRHHIPEHSEAMNLCKRSYVVGISML